MISLLRVWLADRRAKGRERTRKLDAQFMWPLLWKNAAGDRGLFIQLASFHTVHSEAWDDPEEWRGKAEDPRVYASHQEHHAQDLDRAFHPLCPLCRK